MASHQDFRLGRWRISPSRGLVEDDTISKRLTPKAVDVLLCLVQHRRQVVTREMLMESVWQGRAVSDEPLNKCIAELRRQLNDVRGNPQFIETIPKRGYRLVADYHALTGSTDQQSTVATTTATAQSTKTLQRAALTALPIFMAIAFVGWWQFNPVGANSNVQTVAVLPFQSFSADTNKDYFAAGVHEELITALSFNPQLQVRSRTSTLPFNNTTQSLPDIANALGVNLIVEGSVRQEGEQVRVTAQLIEAQTDSHLWSSNYEYQLSVENIFAIQNRIATDIATSLKITLQDEKPQKLPTQNLAAYDNFLLGKYHYRRQLPGDIALSVQYFETAVAADIQFADAWDWLAYAYNHAATQNGYLSPREAYPLARSAALRALDINPDLATALAILGYIRAIYERDWRGGLADLRRALELNPNDSGTVWSLAHILSILQQHDEAIQLTELFANDNRDSGRACREVASRLIDSGQYKKALQWLDKAEALGDEVAHISDKRGIAYLGLQNWPRAVAAFEVAVENSQRSVAALSHLAYAQYRNNNPSTAQQLHAELQGRADTEKVTPTTLAIAAIVLDNPKQTIDYLRQANLQRDRSVLEIHTSPFFDSIKSHPDFNNIISSFGFPVSE